MNAWDFIKSILDNNSLKTANLKYCLMSHDKHPYRYDGKLAKPNDVNDFDTLFDLATFTENLESYAGVGISIQASNISAIDIDSCFENPFDINSMDERAKDAINTFKDKAYIEFSFSGKGLRILFRTKDIENYSLKYYIKNSKNEIEYYQPSNSARYVSITGKAIAHHNIDNLDIYDTLIDFLNKYMLRPQKSFKSENKELESKSLDECKQLLKYYIFKNSQFADTWFSKAPGSGADESERDFYLLQFMYNNITKDKNILLELFETSPFFKSKDKHHVFKWEMNDHRYFKYMYSQLER